VNDISDAQLIETLRRQMTKSVARQVAAAGNLANVDTPGYKAVEPTFDDALTGQLALVGGDPAGSTPRMREIPGATPRRDGNTVEIDRELLSLTRAAGDFSAAQTVLAAKFRLVRYAINEGR
jgi:flagellar basal-body rod protein FlgB